MDALPVSLLLSFFPKTSSQPPKTKNMVPRLRMINYYDLLASLYMHASKPIPRIPPARTWSRTERSIVSEGRKQCSLAS